MRPVTVSVSAIGVSPPIPMDQYLNPFNVGVGVVLSPDAVLLTYSVQHTFDDVFAPGFNPATATWFNNTGLTGRTASADGNYAFAVRAIRLNVTAHTAGSATMTVLQSGAAGA